MRSMTGYGRAEAASSGMRFSVELHSVNRKHVDIALSVPRALLPLESKVKERALSRVSRGRLAITVALMPDGGASATQVINEELALAYSESMRRLQSRLGLEGGLTLDALLRVPGVLLNPGQDADPETAWPAVEKALDEALDALLVMREAEGAALSKDLTARLAALREAAQFIRERAPEIPRQYRKQLLERLASADLAVDLNDERVLRELALFADRCDISEELTRLDSHFSQMEKLQQNATPVGRTLEFLTQEIARELNTLSVKSNDAPISHRVVEAKAELEKIREQVQNIE
jgi:uncharacterized protein (TIGR00255 family)